MSNTWNNQRQRAKTLISALAVRKAMDEGKSVVIATLDQARTAEQMSRHLPGTLFEVVGDMYLRPRKKR